MDMVKKLLLIISLVFFLAPAVWSQSTSFSGLVEDERGALLAGASITLKNLDTGHTRTTVSDEQGKTTNDAREMQFALKLVW